MNYPLQLFRLGIGNTNNNIIAFGSSLYPSHHTGKALEKWYLKYIRADVFLIINALHNLVMTAREKMFRLKNILNLMLNSGHLKE